jgi:hypothetical protein
MPLDHSKAEKWDAVCLGAAKRGGTKFTVRPYVGVCLIAFLSSCGSSDMFEPIGIGPDRDDLKRSPCACVELHQDFSAWAWG